MANKTIADIVREIRECTNAAGEFWRDMEDALKLADRIESAAKRENDRLRAALTPVLACKTLSSEGSMPNYSGCLDAVREAQRIAMESK